MSSVTGSLPDPNITLREARDFAFSTTLGRLALQVQNWPAFPVVLHDLLESIHRLVQSCHMPEFTDHGLPHLCSLIDRLSHWQLADGRLLAASVTPAEAGLLLLATITHDLGMLSQNPQDLPDDAPDWASRENAIDTADWVRRTHVIRLPRLARRLLVDTGHEDFLQTNEFDVAIRIGAAHQQWPWAWNGAWQTDPRHRGLASLVAVTDLLDEDSSRCDTATLLRHREGTALNRGHWLRHGLTANRIMVEGGTISVELHKPPGTDGLLAPVFGALRNHFRLVCLYNKDLASLDAAIGNIHLAPSTGAPTAVNGRLSDWDLLPEFPNERALCYQLLRTFMSEALKDHRRVSPADAGRLHYAGLEDVDLDILISSEPIHEPQSDIEQTFSAISGESP